MSFHKFLVEDWRTDLSAAQPPNFVCRNVKASSSRNFWAPSFLTPSGFSQSRELFNPPICLLCVIIPASVLEKGLLTTSHRSNGSCWCIWFSTSSSGRPFDRSRRCRLQHVLGLALEATVCLHPGDLSHCKISTADKEIALQPTPQLVMVQRQPA